MQTCAETIQSGTKCIRWSGDLDINSASDLQRQLRESCETYATVEVDCTEVESIDTACLQVLMAAQRDYPDAFVLKVVDGSRCQTWLNYAGLSRLYQPAAELTR